MKNSKFIKFTILAVLPVMLLSGSVFSSESKSVAAAEPEVGNLPTTIVLKDCTETEVRNYYSALNNKSESELRGTNLLKNLKPILKNNQKIYSYDSGDAIWKMYEITDRDWERSPVSTLNGEYDSKTQTVKNYVYKASTKDDSKNPYLHALYVNRDADNPKRAWGDHGNRNSVGTIEREHIWPKNHGFDGGTDAGARGDPMHLWAADGTVNGDHSNNFYGYVDKSREYKDAGTKFSCLSGNYSGYSLTNGGNYKVFEPQDSDKGDIARAVFYMVARYNNYANSTTEVFDNANPNLCLTQASSEAGGQSTATSPKSMGIMSDLLEWNHLDPVDEFEIHRNNLLYSNYTNNRNPFIDFPQWADIIWGKEEGKANPSTDSIAKSVQDTEEITGIEITSLPSKLTYYVGETFNSVGMVVSATLSNGSIKRISSYQISNIDMSTPGDKVVEISYKNFTDSFTIHVKEKEKITSGIFKFEITPDEFSGSSYAPNNKEHTSIARNIDNDDITYQVNWFSNNVKLGSSSLQFRNSNETYIFNTTQLGKILSVELETSSTTIKTFYGKTMNPILSTRVGSRFFRIENTLETSYVSKITITFDAEIEPYVTDLSISGNYQTSFLIDEQFNSDNLKVEALYSTGNRIDVTNECEIIPPVFSLTEENEVEIYYIDIDQDTFTSTYTIDVLDYIYLLKVECLYDEYEVGTEFENEDIIITAYYKSTNESIDVNPEDCIISHLDTSLVGIKTVTVAYQNVTGSFTVEVVEPLIDLTGCTGSIIMSSSIVTLASLLGVSLLLKKKEE